jgi:alanine racemase
LYSIKQISKLIEGNFICYNQNDSISHYSIDSRSITNSKNTVFFALNGTNRNGHDFIPELVKKGICNFVVSQDIDIKNANIIQVEDTQKALQLFAQKHRESFNIPIIGVTGSYGKTIVKEWLYQLLKDDYTVCRNPKSYNSQIGVPLSVLQLNNNHTLGIFEAGISRANEMENLAQIINPTIGVFTTIGEAHSAGFSSIEQKEEEKRKLFTNVDIVIDSSKTKGNYNIPFSDKASIENCYTCIAVLEYLKFNFDTIQNRINTLSPLALRLEMKKGKNNCTIINDSYNISYASLEISIDYLNQQAGKALKNIIISDIPDYDYSKNNLTELLNKNKFNTVITIGKNILTGINGTHHHFNTTNEANTYLNTNIFTDTYILIKGARAFEFEKIAYELEEKKHQTVLEINLSQIARNLKFYKKKLNPSTKIMVMVKAFAYGSGTTEIPKLLQHHKVDYLGIAYTDEGVELRKNGIDTPIIVMNPEPNTFNQLIDYNLEPEIYSLAMLDEFVRTLILRKTKDYPIHLKLDTGMNRLGFLTSDVQELIATLKAQPEVYIKTIFSHLSSADNDAEKEFTENQIKLFDTLSSSIRNEFSYKIDRHILNTAGIESFSNHQFDMVRLGIGLYGINASVNSEEVKPAGELKSVIIQKKAIQKGDPVGYGRSFIAVKSMTIGIVPIGYADGLRRNLGNGAFAFFINGEKATIIGNICMDLCMIDLTEIDCNEGDEVEVFGKHQTVETLAQAMDTIPYEVLTSISQRVNRIFYTE